MESLVEALPEHVRVVQVEAVGREDSGRFEGVGLLVLSLTVVVAVMPWFLVLVKLFQVF